MIAEKDLRAERKKNGYTQIELAEKLGVSRQTISKWETGEAVPSTDNLVALAQLYHIPLDELVFHKAPPRDEVPPKSEVPLKPETAEPKAVPANRLAGTTFILSVCAFAAAVAACIGIYLTYLKVDKLIPVDNSTPIEELEGREVDHSLIVESITLQP